MKPYDKPRKGGSFHGRRESREENAYGRSGQGQRQHSSYSRDRDQRSYSSRDRSDQGQSPYPPRDRSRGPRQQGYSQRTSFEQGARSPRDRFMKRARESVQEAFKSRDMVLSGVTKTIDEVHKVINQLDERFESWYEVYLPELKLEDRKKYVEVAVAIDKDNVDFEKIAAIVGNKKAEEIIAMTTRTLGAKLSEKDMDEMRLLGRRILSLYELRESLEKYQTDLTKEIAPNMSEVAGPEIAAKLIAHVGSLKRLAFLPSSTIQVLGAEKALFKHLKNRRIAPPKHGIIFQHAKISNSPKEVRGKIARALANKLALAARADAFSKNFIAKQLKDDFEARCKEILGS